MSAAGPVRAVLVGHGYWGRRLLDIAGRVESLQVVGVVDERAGAPDFAPPAGVPCSADLDAALADPSVEALLVTVPAVGHAAVVERALRAGRHAFVEKPLAVRADDARALLRLAAAQGLMLTVDHQYWWSAEVEVLAGALAAGSVGPLVAVSVQRVSPGPARRDVSAWWDLASHDVATLARVRALRPDAAGFRVSAATVVPDGDVAGCVVVAGVDLGGVEVWVHACWMSSTRRRSLVVTGRDGSLCLEEGDDALALWARRGGRRRLLSRTPRSDRGTPVERALDAFTAGVRGTPDLRPAETAVGVVDLLERVSRATGTDATVVPAAGCWL